MARNQQIMANEYDQFVQKLSDFVNQEFRKFGQRLTLLEGNAQKIQDIGAQAREVPQAMTERVDKVEGQMMLMQSLVKTEAYQAANYRSAELEKKILREVDQKVMALETRLIQRMNEDRQITAIRLQEIKDAVTTVQDGQQKMCGAIEQMRKDLKS